MRKIHRFFGAAAAFGAALAGAAVAQDTTQPNPNPPVNDSAGKTVGEARDVKERNEAGKERNEAGRRDGERRDGERRDGAAASGKDGTADGRAEAGRLYEVDGLVGAKIRNPQNEDLGSVEEFVVDSNTGEIRYAVVSYGGFLGLGDKLFAVPLQAMKLGRNEDGEAFYVVDVDQRRLENAQGFDKGHWPNFADAAFTGGVDKTYGVEPRQASGQAALYKLSTFDGVNVRTREGKEVGEVETILVDPEHALAAYVALDLEDEFEGKNDDADDEEDRVAVVPFEQFTLRTRDDDTFLEASGAVEEIKTAPTAAEKDLKNAASHAALRKKVDGHFGEIDLGTNKAEKGETGK